jgi:hypothetical protein
VNAGDRGLWIGLALGLPVMAFGLGGALVDAERTHPFELARWVIGLALVHDLVVVPVTLALGSALRRVTGWAWPAVGWALAASAVLTAFALPFIRGYGRDPTIPSLLDRDYALGLAVFVAAVWGIAAVVIAATCWARRSGGRVRPRARRPDDTSRIGNARARPRPPDDSEASVAV